MSNCIDFVKLKQKPQLIQIYQNLILMSVVNWRADKFIKSFSYNLKKKKEKFNQTEGTPLKIKLFYCQCIQHD